MRGAPALAIGALEAVGAAPSGGASATTASGSASATSGFTAVVINFSHAAQ